MRLFVIASGISATLGCAIAESLRVQKLFAQQNVKICRGFRTFLLELFLILPNKASFLKSVKGHSLPLTPRSLRLRIEALSLGVHQVVTFVC